MGSSRAGAAPQLAGWAGEAQQPLGVCRQLETLHVNTREPRLCLLALHNQEQNKKIPEHRSYCSHVEMLLASFCSRGPLRGTEESSRVSGPCPLVPCRHLSELGNGDTVIIHGLTAHSRHWKMNYVSFISKKQSQSPFVIKFAVRETLLYLITSDISWLLVLETIKV